MPNDDKTSQQLYIPRFLNSKNKERSGGQSRNIITPSLLKSLSMQISAPRRSILSNSCQWWAARQDGEEDRDCGGGGAAERVTRDSR